MRRALLAADLAMVAVAILVVRPQFAPGQVRLEGFGVEHLRVIGSAVAGIAVAVPLGWWSLARGQGLRPGITAAVLVLVSMVGTSRYADASAPVAFVVNACWLSTAAAGLAFIAAQWLGQERIGRRTVGVIGVVALTGVVTAAVSGANGLGAAFGEIDADVSRPEARLLLALHALSVLLAFGHLAGRGGRRPRLRDPFTGAVGTWVVFIIAERAVHLLPPAAFRDLHRDVYLRWPLFFAVKAPILAAIGMLTVTCWLLVVRPRVNRLPTGVITLSDRDPLDLLRADIASWLGDPSLTLVFDGGSGGSGGSGTAVEPAATDRRRYDRASTTLTRNGQPVGRIEHDISLQAAPDAVATAALLAGVALEANRLLAVSEARLSEARLLNARLLDADRSMRAELLDELEGNALATLEACADAIVLGAPLPEVAADLRAVTAAVRERSHGLYPPKLVERPLCQELPDRIGVPERLLPPAVQITAYLLAVDDPDSRFVDRETTLRVYRRMPITQSAVNDRVDVLGGTKGDHWVDLPIGAP